MPPLLLLPPLLGLPQIDMLRKLLTEYPSANLAGIAVGNEAVSRGDVSEQQLLQYIAQVRVQPPRHSIAPKLSKSHCSKTKERTTDGVLCRFICCMPPVLKHHQDEIHKHAANKRHGQGCST